MRIRLLLMAMVAVLMVLGSAVPAVAGNSPSVNGRITFGRFDARLGDYSIWAANPDGTHQQRLTHVPSSFSDWSPDGRRIVFDFVDDTGVHIAAMDPAGGRMRQLTSGAAIQEVPKWSRDGRWITFDASPVFPEDPTFHTDVWLMRADGSDAKRLTSGRFGVEPVFSPDGRQIAFGQITGVDAQGAQLEAVYVVSTDRSGLRQVVPPTAGLEHPDWSPDGHWITFNIEPGLPNAAVMAIHPNGKGLRVVRESDNRFGLFKSVWSPDGRKFLVGCFDVQAGIDKLCVMDADGRNLHIVLGTADRLNFPAWGSHPLQH